ncbi:hypothetical protein [Aurantimonas sp. DM33-3]|uniref:hypothetical protein n=1 Tax=Aurantimonas sp. DM33-3 TaxID=2766955 RepID=UPI001FEED151|nr:hypothetical protein [Aurantimonas sp. DM33-3]
MVRGTDDDYSSSRLGSVEAFEEGVDHLALIICVALVRVHPVADRIHLVDEKKRRGRCLSFRKRVAHGFQHIVQTAATPARDINRPDARSLRCAAWSPLSFSTLALLRGRLAMRRNPCFAETPTGSGARFDVGGADVDPDFQNS